ncbi:PAS domain-containing protein [Pseudoduganella sp. UC29_106]|uniref:PAS domain-containing protein n=1 Tax=Pseudoduganella sp. UC29_106 TaxID=3374553 RepID=UPI003756B500
MVSALESTPLVAVCSIDRDGVVRFCNAYCAELCGLPSEQVVGRKLAELLSRGERQDEHDRLLAEVWRSGRVGPAGDWIVRTAGGRELCLASVKIPVSHGGHLDQIVCMDVDVTARRPGSDTMLSVASHFEQMFARTSDAVLLLRDGVIEEANPAAVALFKCASAVRLCGRRLEDFLAAATAGRHRLRARRRGNGAARGRAWQQPGRMVLCRLRRRTVLGRGPADGDRP